MKAGTRLDTVIGEYWWRARQQLRREGWDDPTTAQIQELAEWLRYGDFRRHVEPLERHRRALVTQYLACQANVFVVIQGERTVAIRPKPLPAWLEESLAHWDELIAIEARRFGYGETHGS